MSDKFLCCHSPGPGHSTVGSFHSAAQTTRKNWRQLHCFWVPLAYVQYSYPPLSLLPLFSPETLWKAVVISLTPPGEPGFAPCC